MIAKVQVSLIPVGGPALVYAEGRKWMQTMEEGELPKEVLAAASQTGKAYFYVQLVAGRVRFHKQAPAQEW